MIYRYNKYKVELDKLILLSAGILAFLLVIPFWSKEASDAQSSSSSIRYLLAALIAIPTLIYAVKKYRKTASRFYMLPCFAIVVGFWTASMFFMQKLPESLNQNASSFVAKHGDNQNDLDKVNHTHLTHSYSNDEELIFFREKFGAVADTTRF